ncbi:ATP synthase subunit epsilon, mitochondrial [Vitis vinifera]|uniref:ATP synthase subunit epsilon, mitochondrial n=1 Tax=Vitis vinifera TaxID=29760 RepID=A0A438FJD0_VITVI|nr:ATP synthase subunit epsilon, mitochondrial [Vitis vinifera]
MSVNGRDSHSPMSWVSEKGENETQFRRQNSEREKERRKINGVDSGIKCGGAILESSGGAVLDSGGAVLESGSAVLESSGGAVLESSGMTYISYSNIYANLVRNCLKEPFKSEDLTHEKVHFSISKWDNGVPQKPSNPLSLSIWFGDSGYFRMFFWICLVAEKTEGE